MANLVLQVLEPNLPEDLFDFINNYYPIQPVDWCYAELLEKWDVGSQDKDHIPTHCRSRAGPGDIVQPKALAEPTSRTR